MISISGLSSGAALRLIDSTRDQQLVSMRNDAANKRGEEAFRQEFIVFLVSIPAAFWVADGPMEVGILIASVLLLLIKIRQAQWVTLGLLPDP